MDTKFSSAIHMLILISEAETPMTSEEIAVSVGTNASYIRKVTGLLKKKGIVESRQGASGYQLLVKPEKLTLYEVYQAVSDTEQVHVCQETGNGPVYRLQEGRLRKDPFGCGLCAGYSW